tara:strand:- start:1900 stop:2112 length:213 start_codon:yes stop_codon:yes gene_type:complete
MIKGSMFDFLKVTNGWVMTIFSFFKIGWLTGEEDSRLFKCLQIGIGRLELTMSFGWKTGDVKISDIQGYS